MKVCFCLHNHQPVGNFNHVMDSAYLNCYLPMLEVFENHHEIRTGIHISGTLLEWLELNHSDYIERMASLCSKGCMELLTSGRYESILPIFRRFDIVQQIKDYSDYIEQFSERRPQGLWLTERVWEPQLPSILNRAGVSWAVVDDIHLKRAGVSGKDLFRPCITEDSGRTVKLLGSNRELRYTIPFSSVEHVMGKLREMHDTGSEMVFYGDDGEKFGVWPGTHKLCYEDRWLDRFLSELEAADWLDSILPSEAAGIEPAGPFYIPASSYTEMGEWTLHGIQRDEFDDMRQKLGNQGSNDASEIFLSGGFWRNFLSVYPESKELHGRILSAESLVRRSDKKEALHHFWRSQCNCAFWHGVFGGIYLPHLREAVWKELHKAEWIALHAVSGYPLIRSVDINADGHDETVIVSKNQSLLIHPEAGLTVSELTFLHADGEPVPFGHVLSRQREEYHESIPDKGISDEVKSIHDGMTSKEEGLSGRITVDSWRRVSFTDIVMPSSLDWSSWKNCSREITCFQGYSHSPATWKNDSIAGFSGEFVSGNFEVSRKIEIDLNNPVIKAVSEYSLGPCYRAGIEICLNLMTGQSPDRYFRVDDGDNNLMSAEGEFSGSLIEVFDCWRSAKVIIRLDRKANIWIAPLNSVNRSESGFESVHQGAAFYISVSADDTGFCNLHVSLSMEALNDT